MLCFLAPSASARGCQKKILVQIIKTNEVKNEHATDCQKWNDNVEYIYIYIYIYTHTNTHEDLYTYRSINVSIYLYIQRHLINLWKISPYIQRSCSHSKERLNGRGAIVILPLLGHDPLLIDWRYLIQILEKEMQNYAFIISEVNHEHYYMNCIVE